MASVISTVSRASVLAALFAIWIPFWNYFDVHQADVTEWQIESLRAYPDAAVLSELAGFAVGIDLELPEGEMVRLAKQLRAGLLEVPALGHVAVSAAFSPDDMRELPGPFLLPYAALVVPYLYLRAFEATGSDEYLLLATRYVRDWAHFENATRFPRGFQWNDHAVAARAYVLVRFWNIYRNRQDFDPELAQELLRAVSRTAELLSKPSHYTVATNHGVMQNLALVHLSLAFPALDPQQQLQRLGLRRFEDQLAFYLSPEGAVLEHSAGYHEYGLNLLSHYVRYSALAGRGLPDEFARAYLRSIDLYRALRREDRSLPKLGDTLGPTSPVRIVEFGDEGATPLTVAGPDVAELGATVLPVSGYAVWWDAADGGTSGQRRLRSQLVVSWSRYPSNAHKHADELGLTIWTNEGPWISSSGYWPYASPLREKAIAWPASNAPHFPSEPAFHDTSAKITGYLYSPQVAFLDLERTAGGGRSVRRQILRIGAGDYVTIDTAAASAGTTVVWTAAAGVEVRRLDGGDDFVLERPSGDARFGIAIRSERGVEVSLHSGNTEPFLGWTTERGGVIPASAIRMHNDSSMWVVTRLYAQDPIRSITGAGASMSRWIDPDNWTLVFDEFPGSIERRGGEIVLSRNPEVPERFSLLIERPDDVAAARRRITDAYEAAIAAYPRFKLLTRYRVRASVLVAALFVLQETLFIALRRRQMRMIVAIRIASIGFWGGIVAWLVLGYLT